MGCLQVSLYSMKTCSLEFMIHPWHVDVSHTTVLLAIFCKPNLLQGVLIASETPTEHTAITVYLGICFSVNIKLCLMSSLRWILATVCTEALPVCYLIHSPPTSGDTGCWSMNLITGILLDSEQVKVLLQHLKWPNYPPIGLGYTLLCCFYEVFMFLRW